ncbi:MAG: DUF2231 domain-containing protein [Vicinamibacterales bacterium]
MPSLAAFHPQIVHFVVALIVVGVGLRWASLVRPLPWLSPAALTLIALGTLASLAAVRSGGDAHGPVERLPGVRPAVVAHETWGERARNTFLLLLGAEAVAAALAARRHPRARAATLAAGLVGLAGVGVLYRAADLGGVLVYGYGGGVGTRSGAPGDVQQAFISAAAQQALADRAAGRPLDAAGLADLVAARFPDHLEVQLAQVEATIVDRADPALALNRLGALKIPGSEDRLRLRAGLLRAQALEAMADTSAARQVLETLRTEFPASAEIQRRLERLNRP